MTAPTPILPPMLARMPERRCKFAPRCTDPVAAETMMLWPHHQDENLTRLAETHMHPVCAKHLAWEQDYYGTEVDGAMLVIRQLVAVPSKVVAEFSR